MGGATAPKAKSAATPLAAATVRGRFRRNEALRWVSEAKSTRKLDDAEIGAELLPTLREPFLRLLVRETR